MKSITSRSLLPAASCSRIWLRRSTASGALESAIVWFWHTRQRSSWDTSLTRASRLSGWAAMPTGMKRKKRSTTLATAAELLHQRPDLFLRHLGRERPDVLVADHAAAVDDVGFRHPVHAVVDGDAARRVVHRKLVGVAISLEPGQRVLARVLVVAADDRRHPGARELGHYRMLDEARRAPRSPHVEDPHAAEHVLLRERLVGGVQQRQLEARRRLADERRRHLARIEGEAHGEQR